LGARNLSVFDTENSLALQAIEVLREAATVGLKIMALNEEGEQPVEFVVGIERSKEVSGIALS
jgi:hypothetical protein